MARKKSTRPANQEPALKAGSSVGEPAPDALDESAPRQHASTLGEGAAALMASGAIPPPPKEAFDGLPAGPMLVRRGGKLVRLPPAATPPAEAAYLPGKPFAAPSADFGAFPTARPRVYNPTFHAPPPQIAEAKQRAQSLRQVLGMALQNLEHAYHEAMQMQEWLKTNPQAAAEVEREGIDMAQVTRFADEADDVLNTFAPVQAAPPA